MNDIEKVHAYHAFRQWASEQKFTHGSHPEGGTLYLHGKYPGPEFERVFNSIEEAYGFMEGYKVYKEHADDEAFHSKMDQELARDD